MSARSWIAVLLLTNYLMIVGIGCMNRPEDQHKLVLIRTSNDGQHYQQCRYIRMDGLEAFLTEALASRYQNAPETPKHHLISVVYGVDAHYVPDVVWPLITPTFRLAAIPLISYQSASSSGISRAVYPPPRLGQDRHRA